MQAVSVHRALVAQVPTNPKPKLHWALIFHLETRATTFSANLVQILHPGDLEYVFSSAGRNGGVRVGIFPLDCGTIHRRVRLQSDSERNGDTDGLANSPYAQWQAHIAVMCC